MENNDILKRVSLITDKEFAIVKNGRAKHLLNSLEIPKEFAMYHEIPADGVYELSKCNCGSANCDIDKPAPKCVEKGVYSKLKCAVYSFFPLDRLDISYNDFFNLVKKMSSC